MKNYFKQIFSKEKNVMKGLTKNEEILMNIMMMVTMTYKERHRDLYDDESGVKSRQVSISTKLQNGGETYFFFLIPLKSKMSHLRLELSNIFYEVSGCKQRF